MPTKTKLVRYVSPFGSPASMTVEEAERYLEQDERLYDLLECSGLLDERTLRIGRPRIGDDHFHLYELPEWVTPGEDPFATLRTLIRRSEQLGGTWVVIGRAGRYAVTRPQHVIDGDSVHWTAPLA